MVSNWSAAAAALEVIGEKSDAPAVALTRSSTVVRQGLLCVVDLRRTVCSVLEASEGATIVAACDQPQLAAALCGDKIKVWEMALAAPTPATLALPAAVANIAALAVGPEHVVAAGKGLAFCEWRRGKSWRVLTAGAAAHVHSIEFDATQPSVLWVGTGHGPFAIDFQCCAPPILVPMLLIEDAPWCSNENERIAQGALRMPPDIAVACAEPTRGEPAVAVAGGNGVQVVATANAVYVACAITQTVTKLELRGVTHLAVMAHVAVVHEGNLRFYGRNGEPKAVMPIGHKCTAIVGTEAGARIVAGDVVTVVLAQ